MPTHGRSMAEAWQKHPFTGREQWQILQFWQEIMELTGSRWGRECRGIDEKQGHEIYLGPEVEQDISECLLVGL